MKAIDRERLDWTVVVIIILVIGLVCVIVAGQLALRFSPAWQLATNMESHLDPNSNYLTSRPSGFIEPVDPSILTQPGWIDFLTPGVSIITSTPFPTITVTSSASPTMVSSETATHTAIVAASPTNTLVFIPWTPTSTRKPKPTKTIPTATHPAHTPTATQMVARTATATSTTTATSTPTTQTPTDSRPPEIGTTPDGDIYFLSSGGSLTLNINLIANGDGSYDLAYYERAAPDGTGVFLDWVIIEIGDGTNWYTVFNWGNNLADTNSNMDFNILPNPQVPEEADQRDIPTSALYNGTGVAIDVDAIVPPGTYTYIRFTAPAGDSDGQTEIDALEVLP